MANDKAGYLSSVESCLLYSVSSQISATSGVFLRYQFSSFAPSPVDSKVRERVSPLAAFSFCVSQLRPPKSKQRNENEVSVDPDMRHRSRVG
jgi:hypothetical protein